MKKSDMSLRCSSGKRKEGVESEYEKYKRESREKRRRMYHDITCKKEELMVDSLSCFRLKRFQNRKKKKKNKTQSHVGVPHELIGNWSYFQKQTKFNKGDFVNLSELLFTTHRDFLITYNDRGRPVHAKDLERKVIVLHFVPLLPWPEYYMKYETTTLLDIYHTLHPEGRFEVIFIGVEIDTPNSTSSRFTLRKCFEDKLSIMPWPAIPDIKSRTYWESIFPLSGYLADESPASFVIDPTGILLQCNASDLFYLYGARAYPFTDERIECITLEDAEAREHPSVTKLLASSERTHLINNKNQAVPLHNLEDKVVGLYFYEEYRNDELTSNIQKAYEQLAQEENFEIVLIYIHDTFMTFGDASEKSYWKTFKQMPWLALPFKDPVCKKLQRVFKYPLDADWAGPDPSLLIIGPQGKFVEWYGADILRNYGISAYPFSRKRLAKLEVERIRDLNLKRFWGPKTTFIQKDGSTVQLSQLAGKRIIIIVEDDQHSPDAKFWRMLRARYLKVKGTNDEFEVLHICKNKYEYSYGINIAPKSWLRHPSRHPPYRLRFFRHNVVIGLFAFDHDGRVVRGTPHPIIERKNMDFPFGDMEEEFLKELVDKFKLDYGKAWR